MTWLTGCSPACRHSAKALTDRSDVKKPPCSARSVRRCSARRGRPPRRMRASDSSRSRSAAAATSSSLTARPARERSHRAVSVAPPARSRHPPARRSKWRVASARTSMTPTGGLRVVLGCAVGWRLRPNDARGGDDVAARGGEIGARQRRDEAIGAVGAVQPRQAGAGQSQRDQPCTGLRVRWRRSG